ncbi:MAG: hypothetical protein A2Y15_04840 [Clostridiales bacterium GWF2_36_10]|nr:MAG: hypothetical protein A2Y15_04840 [Clostridiales bacterium GWF2_36_10]HAN20839.1 hypothetical protein [Clostridiales bacterium]
MDNLTELQDLLNTMKDSLDKLLVVEKEKTSILEKGSVEDLNNLMNAEQALIMECSAAEKQRVNLCNFVDVQTISELIEKFPETKSTLSPIHSDMTATIESIKKASALNMKLIDTRLKIIKFMTTNLGIDSENPTYSKNVQKV